MSAYLERLALERSLLGAVLCMSCMSLTPCNGDPLNCPKNSLAASDLTASPATVRDSERDFPRPKVVPSDDGRLILR